jgi:hypothetical protein
MGLISERVTSCKQHPAGCWRITCSCGREVREHVPDDLLAVGAVEVAQVHDSDHET